MERDVEGRSWRHVFLLSLAFLVVWWHPGVYNNDEVLQATAMTAFADGELVVCGPLDAGYEPFASGLFRHSALPRDGQCTGWIANVPMMVAAMPLLYALRFLAAGFGIMGALGLVAGAVIGGAVAAELRLRRRIDWAQWGIFAGLAVFVVAWPRDAGFQATPILEMASQQLAGMAAVAAGGVLLWDLARRIWGRDAGWVALGVFLVASPAFFWAGNLKYHGFAMAGIAWAMHALWRAWHGSGTAAEPGAGDDYSKQAPASSGPRWRWTSPRGSAWAWAEAGLGTGIGFWNHGPTGLTMMAGFAVIGLWALLTTRWWVLLGIPGFLVGVLPDFALRWWYRNNLVRPRYFQGSTTGESIGGGVRESAVDQVERTSYLDAPMEYLSTMWDVFVWTPYLTTGTALAVLAMAPWLALAMRRWRPHPLVVWGLVVVATTLIGGGRRLLDIGAGIDHRYVSALWPILAMAAMPAIMRLWAGRVRYRLRWAATWTGIAALWTTLLTAVLMTASGGSILFRGFAYDLTFIHRFGGPVLFMAVALGWLLRRRLPAKMLPHIATVPLVFAASMWVTIGLAGEMHSQRLSTPFVVWPVDLAVWFARGMYGL